MPGKMDRAFTMNRIPVGWIGRTEKLGFQSDANNGLLNGQVYNTGGRFPGCAAGGAPLDDNGTDLIPVGGHAKFGGAEFPAIKTQAVLPGKAASGGRGEDALKAKLLARSHHWNV